VRLEKSLGDEDKSVKRDVDEALLTMVGEEVSWMAIEATPFFPLFSSSLSSFESHSSHK
jgi:hypothetical protein